MKSNQVLSPSTIREFAVSELSRHPIPERLYPPMTEKEYSRLLNGIERWGLLEPIMIQTGTFLVLDGWHRVKACRDLGIKNIPAVEVNLFDDIEIIFFVTDRIMSRRHLSPDRRSAVAALMVLMLEEHGYQ